MLAPNDRRLILDALAPPEGYALDQAIGTTYTLDLLALLRVPLAATALPWSSSEGGPTDNPFALLTALRRNAENISLYCHAGVTRVPARHVSLLTFLEDGVHPVTPPNPRGVFHPKLWLLRYVAPDAAIRYRLLVLSRNLTFDRSWDVALALEGELLPRKRAKSANRPLSEFISALPAMARAAQTDLPEAATKRASLMADEVLRVGWTAPEGFVDDIAFHPIGHDAKPKHPVTYLSRLMILAPFVGGDALARLAAETDHELTLVGRYQELLKLDPESLDNCEYVYIFDDQASLLDVDGDESEDLAEQDAGNGDDELVGLHAKVFLGERAKRAVVFVGSANATGAAFESNVEFLVELEGDRATHGIDAVWKQLEDANLLKEFPSQHEPIEEDSEHVSLVRKVERAAHELGSGGLRASVWPAETDRWEMRVHGTSPTDAEGLRFEARPLSAQVYRPVDFGTDPCCTFPPTALASVTSFFAVRITGRAGSAQYMHDVVLRLALEGAPQGRAEAVTADLLSDRERLLRFMILLLSDDAGSDRVLGELERLLIDSTSPPRSDSERQLDLGLPLLEPMLRTLHHSPERLREIERLLVDLRTAGAPEDLLPPEFEELFRTIRTVRAGL